MFSALYGAICEDKGITDADPAFGSKEHMEMVWDQLGSADFLHKKGDRTMLKQWMSWVGAVGEFLPGWHSRLLILIYLGCELGFWAKQDIPLVGITSGGSIGVNVIGDDESGGADGPGEADAKLKAMRDKASNTLHLSSLILACRRRYWIVSIIYTLSQPVHIAFLHELKNLTSAENVRMYHVQLAAGAHNVVIRRIFERFANLEHLRQMRFQLSFDHLPPASKAASSRDRALDPTPPSVVQDDDAIAAEAFQFGLHLASYRALSNEHYVSSFPHRWALLLSTKEEEEVQKALMDTAETWAAIGKAEVAAHKCAVVARVLRACLFANWTTEREIMIGLRQVHFKLVPKWIADTLRGFFEGYGQSAIVENAFGKCQDLQRESKNKRMSRLKRYHTPYMSRLLPDRFGRPEVKVDGRDRPGDRRVPRTLFEPFSSEPSVDDSSLRRIMSTANWPTTTALGLHKVVAAHHCLKELNHVGFQKAAEVWKSEFVLQGFVLQDSKQAQAEMLLVLASNSFGVLTWPMQRVAPPPPPAARLWRPSIDQHARARWLHVFSFDAADWRVWPTTVCSPIPCRSLGPKVPAGICFLLDKSHVSILQAAFP